MAKEVLELEVKSNVSSAVESTKKYVQTLQDAQAGVKEVNAQLKAQNQFILDQEKELLKLKTAQSEVAKGSWNAGAIKRAEDINTLTNSLKENKLALQQIKVNQKEATEEVKAFTEANKENGGSLLNDIKNYKVMGISINGIGKAFKKIIPAAKAAFTSIKAGMISTGVGALVVAFGALVAWFTKTKAGAESLEKIFAAVGAVVKVFVDRIISYGKMLYSIITLDFKGAAENAKAAFGGLGDELAREIALTLKLKADLQALADSERELTVETAQRKAEIEDLKRKSDDLNLTEEERLEALRDASVIEQDLMDKRVANAEEALRIQEGQMSMSHNMKEDLQALADLEINLANIRRESSKIQITLQRKENRINKQVESQKRARHAAYRSRKAAEKKIQNDLINDANKRLEESYIYQLKGEESKELAILELREKKEEAEIKAAFKGKKNAENQAKLLTKLYTHTELERQSITRKYDKIAEKNVKAREDRILAIENETLLMSISNERDRADKTLEIQEKLELDSVANLVKSEEYITAIEEKYAKIRSLRKTERGEEDVQNEKDVAAAKNAIREANIDNIASGIGLVKSLAGENKEIQAAAIIAENAAGIAKTIISTQTANAGALATPQAIASSGTLAVPVIAANNISAAISIATSVAATAKGLAALGGGGGGGGGGNLPSTPPASSSPPSSQMMSGSFELEGGQEVDPLQAYVVSDDITANQDKLAVIRRRATI